MTEHKHHTHDTSCAYCDTSDGPLVMHAKCHMGAPQWVWKEGNILTLKCAVCERVVTKFKILEES